jgi:hypothetical protein
LAFFNRAILTFCIATSEAPLQRAKNKFGDMESFAYLCGEQQ